MYFEWDTKKENINIKKHGISFSVAIRIFGDNNRIEWYDEKHSQLEDRFITIGEISGTFVVVTVVYTEKSDVIRVISARLATKNEKDEYYARKKIN